MTSNTVTTGYQRGFIGRMVELHASYYGNLWGLGSQFEADIAKGLAEFFGQYDSSRDGVWKVTDDSNSVRGGIVIDGRDHAEEGAQLRYFILDPVLHERGLGHTLLTDAMSFCETKNYNRVFLWTVDELEAAIDLYKGAGFRKTDVTKQNTEWNTSVTYRMYEWTY